MIKQKIDSMSSWELASWIIIALILAPFVAYAVPQTVMAKDAYIVQSGSMEPTIPTGSVIWASGVKPENINEQDIITYRSGTRPNGGPEYTTHRVVDIRQNDGSYEFKTKGDKNQKPDPGWVQEENVVARHMVTVPQMGYLLHWLGTVQAFVALVVIPATILIFNELYKIAQEIRGIKKEGNERDLLETVAIALAAVIFLAAVAMFTGYGQEILQETGSVSLGPTEFGLVVMASLILSMIGLKFI